MNQSRRMKRMQRHHKRGEDKNTSLNMVSLMDIFTILVFFLLVSAANTEALPTPKNINLPESTADKTPKENIIIMVIKEDILVQGIPVAKLSSINEKSATVIKSLLLSLQEQTTVQLKKLKTSKSRPGVTIMGDKSIPYHLLKKIMLTCATANLTNISLAVNQKATDKV
ncbi:MAG: biopolymer transporter ExbD [Gammaproteobacteria bacterium]|nr:biopolymer transporter ExbD [Gammaproteobacteria bacterium]